MNEKSQMVECIIVDGDSSTFTYFLASVRIVDSIF